MIQKIMRDQVFLEQKTEPATLDDLPVTQDLLDTPAAHKDGCVGMAANMIGVNKRIIAFDNDGSYMKVQYQNEKFQTHFKTFTGWTAQIIQHEIGHCEGVLI